MRGRRLPSEQALRALAGSAEAGVLCVVGARGDIQFQCATGDGIPGLAAAAATAEELLQPEDPAALQRALADCERYLGPDHQMTQTVRENLDAATQS